MKARGKDRNQKMKQIPIKLSKWLIIPYEWQIPIILYNFHTKSGSHLRIQPTQTSIIDEEYN